MNRGGELSKGAKISLPPLSPSGQQWQVKKAGLKGVQGALCTFHVSLPVQRIKERWVGSAEVGRRKRKERKRGRGKERERKRGGRLQDR